MASLWLSSSFRFFTMDLMVLCSTFNIFGMYVWDIKKNIKPEFCPRHEWVHTYEITIFMFLNL